MTKTIPIHGEFNDKRVEQFSHGFYPLVLTVLNIWTFVFEICFGFRDSVFVFFQASFVSHRIGRTFLASPLEEAV